MTLQREDIKLLEELIRKVVREELENIVNKASVDLSLFYPSPASA